MSINIIIFTMSLSFFLEVIIMNINKNKSETIIITLGDLIETITKIALKTGTNKDEGYLLASLTLEKILNKRGQNLSIAGNI